MVLVRKRIFGVFSLEWGNLGAGLLLKLLESHYYLVFLPKSIINMSLTEINSAKTTVDNLGFNPGFCKFIHPAVA